MQIPENPDSGDIRDALLRLSDSSVQLRQDISEVRQELKAEISGVRQELKSEIQTLSEKVDRQDYRFDAFQRGTDGMVRMAVTIIIATATVVGLPSLSLAIRRWWKPSAIAASSCR